MKFLIVLGILVVVAVAYPKDDFKCIEGVPLKRNDCNYCTCGGGKVGICTANMCPWQNKTLTECQVGLAWMKDCNHCWCDTSGTMCEDKECPDDLPEIDDMDESTQECIPGVPLKENDCNYCNCGTGGKVEICTLIMCNNPLSNALRNCQVGRTWMKDCNRCWCNTEGTMCEAKECPSDLPEIDDMDETMESK